MADIRLNCVVACSSVDEGLYRDKDWIFLDSPPIEIEIGKICTEYVGVE